MSTNPVKKYFLDRNKYMVNPDNKIGCEQCVYWFEFPISVFVAEGQICNPFYACEEAFNEYAQESGLQKNGNPIKTIQDFKRLKGIFQVVSKGFCKAIKERN